ncbi:MAG: PIN domain-containing protein [Deltaproteobacteria bacterium]|nr:PIN domain-containing protein [Deltaproteobacteria bacterium]
MKVIVDTSVWSLALRRDDPPGCREVELLRKLIDGRDVVCLTGTILQETLQGFRSDERFKRLVRALAPFPLVRLARADYVFAAEIRSVCRSGGIQVGTMDAQIAAAAIRHECSLLTTDRDFHRIGTRFPLDLA